ncbi:MAG: response regulator [Deltaproteobacteria bacterium]|nr:MAG: response regulator [Deltaproteobacteria bacterium]
MPPPPSVIHLHARPELWSLYAGHLRALGVQCVEDDPLTADAYAALLVERADPVSEVRSLRDRGFTGPVVVIATRVTEFTQQRLTQAGATYSTASPTGAGELGRVLRPLAAGLLLPPARYQGPERARAGQGGSNHTAFFHIFETLPQACAMVAEDGHVLAANQTARHLGLVDVASSPEQRRQLMAALDEEDDPRTLTLGSPPRRYRLEWRPLAHAESTERILCLVDIADGPSPDGRPEVLSSLSLELHAALATVLNYAEAARDGKKVRPMDQAARAHLLDVIGELLELAQLELLGPPMKPETTSLAEMVDIATRECRDLADRSHIRLNMYNELYGVWGTLCPTTTTRLFTRVLAYALTNHAAPREVQVYASCREEMLTLIIDDGAPLFSESEAESLLRPLSHQTAPNLGLAITARTAISMGGSLHIAGGSQGNRFTLRVPFRRSRAPTVDLPVHPREALRVLVVDDDPMVRTLLGFLMDEAGWAYSSVGDGKEAIEAMKTGPLPDLVLLDLEMPVMDGIKTVEAIHSNPMFRHVAVVGVTANEARERDRFLAAGCDAVVPKPLALPRLLEQLCTIALQAEARPVDNVIALDLT